jgi:hypothetical protein
MLGRRAHGRTSATRRAERRARLQFRLDSGELANGEDRFVRDANEFAVIVARRNDALL